MRFWENECRFCKKVFCCKKCRLKHENDVHYLNIHCDICKYGYVIPKNINEPLFEHIKKRHWPLHCVFCKCIFHTFEDLKQPSKCFSGEYKDELPKTPYRTQGAILVSTEDSPILLESQVKDKNLPSNHMLVTSTPMQRNEYIKKDFNKNNEVVTPVDHVQQGTNNKDSDSPMQVTKRRVTFCEISIANNTKNNTPDREIDEVKPKVLSEQFSEDLKEPSTPVRPIHSANDLDPQLEFSTPARSEESLANADDHMEFSTPARFNPENTTCTTDPDDKSHDEFKEEIEEILSKDADNDSAANDNKEEEIITNTEEEPNEKETYKEGSTIWMSALNLSEDLLSDEEGKPDNKDETRSKHLLSQDSENQSYDVSKHSPPIIISSPPKVAHPTPILKKTVIKEEQNLTLDDNKENITMNSPVKNRILKMHPTPHPILKRRDINRDLENIENKTPNIDKKLTQLHPTPYPVVKQCDAKTEDDKILAENKDLQPTLENGTPITNKTEPKSDAVDLQPTHESDSPISHKLSPEKRVVRVHPTPIIKRTNIHMKFQIPAHFSSTPILNMHPQPKIVKKILTQQIVMHQGEANFSETSTTELVRQINESESISGIDKDLHARENLTESEELNMKEPKSNLWTSMTKIVKRVIQNTVSLSSDSYNMCDSSDNQLAIASSSFKRHYSESDSPEMALAPRSKRFKFTDIKCRRPIRDLSPSRPSRMLALPSTTTAAATFEIVKSVTTSHGLPEKKVYVDKSTQTDD